MPDLTPIQPVPEREAQATLPPRAADPATAATLAPAASPVDAGAVTLAPAAERPAAAASVEVPGYDILGELGRGGMGVVYQARQTRLGRFVALKMILSGAHAGSDDLARFRTEGEAIARLQHPNIVQIHEIGEHGGLPYFSLEFCGGGSLERKLAGTPVLPKEAAALVETLARAMDAAHQKGVIHRDLKPANVLLAEDGTPKITDFGLARKLDEAGQTATGAVMGTPSYMAPEQAGHKPDAQARNIGPAADVYALGAILYECLTGRPPFKAATPLDTILQVVSEEPVAVRQLNGRVPRDLETVCLKCLHKEAAKRYGSAGEPADDLGRFLAAEAICARPVGGLERAAKWVQRNPVVASLTAAVALLLVLGTTLSSSLAWSALRQAQLAKDNAAAEAKAKEEAEQQTKLAKENATRADENAAEAGRQVERFKVANGQRLLDGGDLFGALLWFAQPLTATPPSADEEMHRYRLSYH